MSDGRINWISTKYDPPVMRRTEQEAEVLSVAVSDVGGAQEPLTVSEVKRDYLMIAHSRHDERIDRLLKSIRRMAERRYGISIVRQTVTVRYGGPALRARVPRLPVSSIDTVSAIDEWGASSALTPADYEVEGRMLRRRGYDLLIATPSRIEVVMTTGWGTKASDVPEEVREGLGLGVQALYNQGVEVLTPEAAKGAWAWMDEVMRSLGSEWAR